MPIPGQFPTYGGEPFVRENTGKMVSSGGGRGGRKRKINVFPQKIRKQLPKPAFLRSRDQGASTHIKHSKFKPIPTHSIHHFTFFSLFCPQQIANIRTFFKKIIYLHKNQAPGPIANERSLNSASDTLIKSSGNLHPTDLVTKEG